ncbi:LysR family transcriptional regulator [Cellvibrio fibrivorans]|uniref:DNA-binding transcriptional LysR family regulator n=1 Tax=Cellvibrio fibrivorans TaxID=126350 RepID=A0ABU1UZQ7_9GAMM|nr:LysR family transcriptional regulator [Cellvibrio fibrivorans]MDR7090608.1 DNA-binding transcriptional LysR family regulator [Cellvibrio fibrivorans]
MINKEHKKLERLMLFSEVAQHLSYTVAAERLGISRGHLSSQVRRLEKDMGMTLLIRSTRSVRLTNEGQWVMTGMEKIFNDLQELERNVENEGQAIEGLLKIAAPLQFSERYLLDICAQFKAFHPNIEFSIDCSYPYQDLNRSDFNIAFRGTNEPPQNMIAVPLFTYQYYCCAAPEYFIQHGKPQTAADFSRHQCLRSHDQPDWTFAGKEIECKGWLQINNSHLLKHQALKGVGIIRAPDYMVEIDIAEGRLEFLQDEALTTSNTMHIIYPQLIHQSKRLSAFIQFCRQYFAQVRPRIN